MAKSVIIGKLSLVAGNVPYLTSKEFAKLYSPLIVGDQKEAYKIYKKNMKSKTSGVSESTD